MLIDKIKKNKKSFLILLFGAVVLATSAAFILPEKFEAKVTVRNATVGQMIMQQQGQQILQAGLIETNTQSLSRLSSPRFYTDKLLSECGLTQENAAESLSKTLTVAVVKLTYDLTTISYVGKGKEMTQACLQAIVDHLSKTQEEISEGKKRQLQAQLTSQKAALIEMEKSEKDLNNALIKNGMSNRSPAESALMLYGIQAKQNIIQEARRLVIELEASLLPPATQKLMALEPIYVSTKPVSPNPWLFGFAGLFLGLLICAGFCWREILALVNSDD
jgi:hypothetical protein